jgi:O-antigen ligase
MPLLSFGALSIVLFFVFAALLEKQPLLPLVLVSLIAAIAVVALRGNEASLVALAIGLGGAAAVFLFGRRAVLVIAVLLPLLFVSSAVIVRTADAPAFLKEREMMLPNSIGHRLIIWRFVYDKARERPVLGWGLHTSRRIPGRETRVDNDPDYADIMDVTTFWIGAKIEKMPMHPHNATLQMWLELGVVGIVLYALLYGLCLWAISRLNLSRIALAAGTGGVVAVFVMGQVSFSAWQSWWLCTQFLAAAAFLYMVRKAPPASAAAAEGRAQ